MINSNKILTVSYGTFSCTLEGFDDSFGTMKAIAEYFRDLSADDRYFGAEPVQPDAQMLARIAQREISRQVDAREDDGRIVLSARELDDEVAPAAVQAPPAAPKVPAEETAAPDQEIAQAPAEDIISPAAQAAPIEAVAEAEIVEEAMAEPEDAPVTLSDDSEHDIVPSLPDADVEAFFAESTAVEDTLEIDDMPEVTDTPAVDDASEDMAEQEPAQMRAKTDSIAEKLKRIRAVVSHQPEAEIAPDYSEDQHAEASSAPAMADIADEQADDNTDMLSTTLRDIEDALDEDDTYETETADAELDAQDDEEDDIAAILNRLEAEAETDLAEDVAETAPAYDDEDADFEADLDSLLDEQEEDDAEAGNDTTDNILAAMEDDADSDDADNMFDAAPEPVVKPKAAAPVRVKPAAPRARVLKVKRATLEAAIKSGQLEEYDDDQEQATAPAANQSSLSAEAEEDLARELAELEADMRASKEVAAKGTETKEEALSEAEADIEAQPEIEVEAELEPTEAPRTKLDAGADESFSRLMEETEQQMDEPEGTTRRDAFAHLRAAVAAKKADEAVGGTLDAKDSDEAYRDDLASVVRPRRPSGSDRPRTERPTEQRPAPLKLVAEQRIDTAEPRRVTPVRPRRVVAAAVPPAAEPDTPNTASFADFAAEMGAQQLPDLLEAAAAYLSFVEGHEEFSRPQLMTKVRQVEKENFTREDGLRSFGKLLREGKIQKLSGGRFQASDQIGFKPSTRAAG